MEMLMGMATFASDDRVLLVLILFFGPRLSSLEFVRPLLLVILDGCVHDLDDVRSRVLVAQLLFVGLTPLARDNEESLRFSLLFSPLGLLRLLRFDPRLGLKLRQIEGLIGEPSFQLNLHLNLWNPAHLGHGSGIIRLFPSIRLLQAFQSPELREQVGTQFWQGEFLLLAALRVVGNGLYCTARELAFCAQTAHPIASVSQNTAHLVNGPRCKRTEGFRWEAVATQPVEVELEAGFDPSGGEMLFGADDGAKAFDGGLTCILIRAVGDRIPLLEAEVGCCGVTRLNEAGKSASQAYFATHEICVAEPDSVEQTSWVDFIERSEEHTSELQSLRH